MKIDHPIIDSHVLLGVENHLQLDIDELLRRMDTHGIETSVARPMGADLVVYNEAGNTRILKAHSRIRGMATVNPWYGDKAIDELKRCQDLNAVGLFLHPSRQGFMPTDAVVRPILDWVNETGWPVMFHTGSYVESDILALGEMARKYPDINFIAGFGGFSDMWFELPGVLGEVLNMFLDVSMLWGGAIEEVVKLHGQHRVLWGSAEPRNRYAVGINSLERIDLTKEELRAVLLDNAKRIYRLP